MNSQLVCSAFTLVALASCGSTAHRSEAVPAAPPEATGSMDDMLSAMTAMAAPGPEHAALNDLVGSWDAVVKTYMTPGAPPLESTGRMENRWILGGRHIQGEFNGSFLDMPFSGMLLLGYDNTKQRYFSTWGDTMSTYLLPFTTGTRDGMLFVFKGETRDPATGDTMQTCELMTITDHDHYNQRMSTVGADGFETLQMEIFYQRAQ